MALVREHADWWNVPAHHLDRLAERRGQAGTAQVSIQTMAAVIPDESRRAEVTERAQRRYGATPMGRHLAVGSPAELTEHFGARHAEGIDRFYVWFTDTAPPETLAAFAEVVTALR
jgi:alkanesulfonate monooxygenase SsuD/methylene tetrahydromethanopterin reductase-like flavin-dependent oxidoreductase (luciferase family)